jgi:MoxR-like ATPase
VNVIAGRPLSAAEIRRFADDVAALKAVLNRAIVGQEPLIEDLLVALLAGGHVLLEGLPGLGKTQLIKTLAHAVGLDLARIQCTPDLMPADVTGSEILANDREGKAPRFVFQPGPLFASLVLVDEVNRATPKTQAALLEAMQEHQVTYAGHRHPLPSPFWVLATQNPIELEGTFPLPEAQLDRFLSKLKVAYPSPSALLEMIDQALDREPAEQVATVIPAARLIEMIAAPREVVVATRVKKAAVDLVLATHPGPAGDALARTHFRYGASPRALLALLRSARVRALAAGRGHVDPADVAHCAPAVLRHRVLLNIESELKGVDVDAVLADIIATWQKRL